MIFKLFKKKEVSLKKKLLKQIEKRQKILIKKYSSAIWSGNIFISNNLKQIPNYKENIIELIDVEKIFFHKSQNTIFKSLKHVNLQIKRGEFCVILGSTGEGKTTLLNLMSGLDRATRGDVFFDGYNLTFLKSDKITDFIKDNVAFIFQNYALINEWNARENIAISYFLNSNSQKKQNQNNLLSFDNLVKLTRTGHLVNNLSPVSVFSGGEQQRISILRALSKDFQALFCDEPTGSLDEETSDLIFKILKMINEQLGKTIIVVTHNSLYKKFATRQIIRIKNHEIEIEKVK